MKKLGGINIPDENAQRLLEFLAELQEGRWVEDPDPALDQYALSLRGLNEYFQDYLRREIRDVMRQREVKIALGGTKPLADINDLDLGDANVRANG